MANIVVRNTGIRFADSRVWVYADISAQAGRASITLDMSKFTAATHFPKGYLPSGLLLGKITASGLYGPYDNTATDGRETATGWNWDAFTPTDLTGKETTAMWFGPGAIKESKLPAGHGLDAAGKTDLGAWFKFF